MYASFGRHAAHEGMSTLRWSLVGEGRAEAGNELEILAMKARIQAGLLKGNCF